MIVDMHTHVPRESGAELEDFLAEMDRCGIDMAGVAAIEPGEATVADMPHLTNEHAYECIQRHPDRLFGWCSVLPYRDEAPDLLERYVREMGFTGLKLHPPAQGFAPTDERIFPTILKAVELDVPILIHTGVIYHMRHARIRHGDPTEIDELAVLFPEAKIVMAHGDPLGVHPAIAAKHDNVYMDTSFRFCKLVSLIPGLGEDIIERQMPGSPLSEKILFGSDANPNMLERFGAHLDSLRHLEISEEHRERILGENAVRLLNLPRRGG